MPLSLQLMLNQPISSAMMKEMFGFFPVAAMSHLHRDIDSTRRTTILCCHGAVINARRGNGTLGPNVLAKDALGKCLWGARSVWSAATFQVLFRFYPDGTQIGTLNECALLEQNGWTLRGAPRRATDDPVHSVRRFSGISNVATRKLAQLDAANTLEFLRSPPGNRLDALQGRRTGQYSIRVNDQFRLCFRWTAAAAEDVEIVD